MNRFRSQRGQTLALSVLFLTVLLGMAALVLDVGSWYRADRAAQATADAAALAAAQALPADQVKARDLALQYAKKNTDGGDPDNPIETVDVAFPAADTVKVTVERQAEGFFAKLFSLGSAGVRATASARTAGPAGAKYVAPIVVNEKHPMLNNCDGGPCFGTSTTLKYHHLKTGGEPDGAGSFGFINLKKDANNPGTSELGDWILHGFDEYMEPDDFPARTGNPFSSGHVQASLEEKMTLGEELLFPVYRKLTGTGSGATYEIIGWVGFVVTSMDLAGNNELLHGYFTQVIWEGIQTSSGNGNSPGVLVIKLVE